MAVPSYTTDLSTFNNVTTTTNFIELSGYTSGSKEGIDPDLAIYGSVCMSASNRSAAPCSLGYTGTAMTLATNECVFIWQKFFAPNSLDTEANGGIIVGVGNTNGNYYKWTMDGSDSYPYGGWLNYAVDPTKTTGRTTVGSPSGTWSMVGVGWDMINGISKGNALQIDIIRYGRGESIFTGGQAANYATFAGYAAVNDNPTTGRFGLIQEIAGGYLYKGLMTLGTSGTLVDFRDSNVNVTIDNTKHVSSAFNRIEINNASSNIEWNTINFTNLGTVSKGEFEMIANATVAMSACNFTDMSTFIFQSNATLTSSNWLRTGQVTQGGATFDSCKFIESTAATSLLVSDLDEVYDSSFESDGSNHAIELTAAHAGGTYDLIGCSFTSYATADGSTGNEVIYNNSGGAVTINASGITGTISIRNGTSATTNLVLNPVATQITAKDVDGDPIENARVLVWATDNSNYFSGATVTITGSGTTATVAHTAHGMVTGDYVWIQGVTNDDTYNGQYSVTVTGVNAYTYTTNESINIGTASGTITSTFVVISELSSALGVASDTRSWAVDQPISGRVRKSSASPFYVTGTFTGTIDKDIGFLNTIQLVSDE